MKISRLEAAVLLVMGVCLASILIPAFIQKRQGSEIADAILRVDNLYRNEMLQYYGSRRFLYSVTVPEGVKDFSRSAPPVGKPMNLVGHSGKTLDAKGNLVPHPIYTAWENIGFKLLKPSFFLYRVEPEPAFDSVSLLGKMKMPLNFHALAIGDTDGDGRYAVLMRSGYVDGKGQVQGSKNILANELQE